MPSYRIHHLKDHLRQHFRFAPHVSGTANVKPKDYELGGTVEATSAYAAYFALRRPRRLFKSAICLKPKTVPRVFSSSWDSRRPGGCCRKLPWQSR